MLYWIEYSPTGNNLVSRMVWHNFTALEPNFYMGNSNVDNDNIRMCVSWKPKDLDQYESCNFFMRRWGKDGDIRLFDGVKHLAEDAMEKTGASEDAEQEKSDETEELKEKFENMKSDPSVWCSLNWMNPSNTKPVGCKIRKISTEKSTSDMPWSTNENTD